MHDSKDLLKLIKKAAYEAVEASQPADFCFGTVTKLAPLSIKIEDKLTLTAPQLVCTETIKTLSPLVEGDEVVLFKKKGGQRFLILDKVVTM